MENKYKQPNDWIAIAKGIAIMLVVLGHTAKAEGSMFVFHFVNFIHVPLFFFASGFFFDEKYFENKSLFIFKRIRGLYVPFVKYGLMFLLLHNSLYTLGIYTSKYGWMGETNVLYGWSDIFSRFINIIVFRGGGENLLGAFWFLPVLFVASILAMFYLFFIHQLSDKMVCMKWGGVILFILLAFLFSKVNLSVWEFNRRSFLAVSIYLLGFIMKNYSEKILLHKEFVAIRGLRIVSISAILYPKNMSTAVTFFELLYFSIISLSGIFAIFSISKMLSKTVFKSFLVFIGQNTLVILGLHFLCFKLVNYAKICYYDLNFDMLSCFPVIFEYNNALWMLLYCVVGIFIPLAIPAVRKYMQTKLNLLRI